MKLLVLGGSAWLGREADAYAAVADEGWDVVVEVSWQPRFVRVALRALADARGIGRTSRPRACTPRRRCPAPARPPTSCPPTDLDEAEREQYGPAKAACELACASAVGDRLLIARPGLIGGPGERERELLRAAHVDP